ncbi:hypothetical protein LV779_37440 [Streptomyces thinghirensis]|nr:hypothetical protein [Streptomyces thinghirensis]
MDLGGRGPARRAPGARRLPAAHGRRAFVAALTAGLICARTLQARRPAAARWAAAWRHRPPPSSHPLPEFLVASVLATVVGVQLGWLPALGWYGPQWTVLPALALEAARRGGARAAARRSAARRVR